MSTVRTARTFPGSARPLPQLRPLTGWRIPGFARHLALGIPLVVLVAIVLGALLAPFIAPYDPNALDMKAALSGPSATHWFGTDQLGRDQFSRVLYGGRITLLVAAAGVTGVIGIGVIVGSIAGYFGGRIDAIISSLLNILLALPSLLLTLAILGILGPGTKSLLIAIIGAGWVGHARIFRSTILALRERPFIEAAVSAGAGSPHILLKHLWPNLMTQVVVLATLDAGALILTVTSLSFLGLGVQPPTADWGTMLNDARPYVAQVPLLAIVPGACITIIALTTNLIGDAVRDRVDTGRDRR